MWKVIVPLLLLAIAAVMSVSCEKNCHQSDRCFLEPESGVCLAAIPRYYYDRSEKKCKQFTWGGCGGVVPFETLQECENACGCK